MTIATATPTASSVPKADGSGKLADGWLPAEVPLTDENNTFTKAQRSSPITLASSASITPDFSLGNNFQLTLAAIAVLNNPSNIVVGQSGIIVITQDGTGNRTLSYGSYWKFLDGVAPTLSTAAGAIDILAYHVHTATFIATNFLANQS